MDWKTLINKSSGYVKKDIKEMGFFKTMFLYFLMGLSIIAFGPFYLIYTIAKEINEWSKTWFDKKEIEQ